MRTGKSFRLPPTHWKVIALQYCLGFCHTSMWISHRYTYVPSLLNPSPTTHPILAFRLSQSTGLSSLCHTANFDLLSILHLAVYMFLCYSFNLCYPLLHTLCLFYTSASPLLPCKEVHQPHHSRFNMHLSFYFWVTSICRIGSRFINHEN